MELIENFQNSFKIFGLGVDDRLMVFDENCFHDDEIECADIPIRGKWA